MPPKKKQKDDKEVAAPKPRGRPKGSLGKKNKKLQNNNTETSLKKNTTENLCPECNKPFLEMRNEGNVETVWCTHFDEFNFEYAYLNPYWKARPAWVAPPESNVFYPTKQKNYKCPLTMFDLAEREERRLREEERQDELYSEFKKPAPTHRRHCHCSYDHERCQENCLSIHRNGCPSVPPPWRELL